MVRIDRLRPSVVFHIELFPKIDKLLGDAFDEFRWRNARLGRGLLDLLAVLIDAGQIKNFFAFEPMITRDHIGQHFFVSVPDVRRRIRVIDRRGDEKGLRHSSDKLANESWQSKQRSTPGGPESIRGRKPGPTAETRLYYSGRTAIDSKAISR